MLSLIWLPKWMHYCAVLTDRLLNLGYQESVGNRRFTNIAAGVGDYAIMYRAGQADP